MIDAGHQQIVRLALIVLTGGLSSAVSIGALVHTHHAQQQALQKPSAATDFYEHQAGNALPIVAAGTRLKVQLTNGSVVEGTVKATHQAWIKLAAEELGAITLAEDKIARIEWSGAPEQRLQFNAQHLKTDTTPAPRQRAQPTSMKYQDHDQQAQLRNEQVAQQRKVYEEKWEEQNKWRSSIDNTTSLDNTPSIDNTTSLATERHGQFTPIRWVRSSPATATSRTPEPDLNQLSGEALYQRMMMMGRYDTPAEGITAINFDGRPPTTRIFTNEEKQAAQKWYRDEQKKASQEYCARHPEDKGFLDASTQRIIAHCQ